MAPRKVERELGARVCRGRPVGKVGHRLCPNCIHGLAAELGHGLWHFLVGPGRCHGPWHHFARTQVSAMEAKHALDVPLGERPDSVEFGRVVAPSTRAMSLKSLPNAARFGESEVQGRHRRKGRSRGASMARWASAHHRNAPVCLRSLLH